MIWGGGGGGGENCLHWRVKGSTSSPTGLRHGEQVEGNSQCQIASFIGNYYNEW